MAARKIRKEPVIKYPIFEECAKLEDIPFWKTLFEEFSKGIFPKGFAFKDKALTYKRLRKKGLQKIDLPTNPREAKETVKNFVKSETGTIPVDEMIRKRIEMSIALKQNLVPDDMTWKDIRAPTIKRQLINAYVYDYVEGGAITEMEGRNLAAVIISGLDIKAIKPEDVILKDGKITDINGIDYDENGFFLSTIPEIRGEFSQENTKNIKQTCGCAKWEKMHKQYETYIRKGSSVK